MIPAASAVVVGGDGRVLLVRRGRPPLEGVLTPPGGRVDPGETPAEAAVREVHEETGLAVRVLEHVGTVDAPARSPAYRIDVHLAAPAEDARLDALIAASDAREIVWAKPEELERLGVPEETRRVIMKALERAAALGRADEHAPALRGG